ncbi:ABC transporter permease [Nonomuraea gerenzanensis]|uniref:ABC-type multidrug transport system, permease component n=1 Tax=Nonomuraea gerenzanensis TaxID=93944 RepID=A0A1M4EIC8_9ACTN|nr:ABC transporter permease [Nonomuraea gerenzanensis]UBU10316.1 ABC transporter permease [Nonomuraea gerenzanensis]SBO98701.1 ABC-type multidrug transport system, permease component [Nonomuraea gerenzanensis]
MGRLTAGRAPALRRIAVLAGHNVLLRRRDPAHFVSYLVMPMVLMLIFKSMLGEPAQAVTGLLVMFSVLSMADVATATLTERTWHTWDRLRATRATVTEMVIGKALPVFAVLVVQQSVLLVYGVLAVGLRPAGPVWPLALAVTVWSFTLLCAGTAVAGVVRSQGELSTLCNLAALSVSALGGALVPYAMMPGWAQAVAPLSPGYWATTMLQAAVRGDAAGTAGPAAVLAGLGLAAGAFACRRLGKGWSRAAVA